MKEKIIEGVILTKNKQISAKGGDVFHGLTVNDPGFEGFGEAYFSTINNSEIKAWKRHKLMTLNFIVIQGEIKVVLFDDRKSSSTRNRFNEFKLSRSDYYRLTIPPLLWVGFQSLQEDIGILLNIANLPHSPKEVENKKLEEINYSWQRN